MTAEMRTTIPEPLPGLNVAEGLILRDLDGLRAAVANGLTPRVRMLARAGQVAGQRGTVVAVGRPTTEVVEYVQVRMDRDGDVLPFAPDELHLLSAVPAGAAGPAAQLGPRTGVPALPAGARPNASPGGSADSTRGVPARRSGP